MGEERRGEKKEPSKPHRSSCYSSRCSLENGAESFTLHSNLQEPRPLPRCRVTLRRLTPVICGRKCILSPAIATRADSAESQQRANSTMLEVSLTKRGARHASTRTVLRLINTSITCTLFCILVIWEARTACNVTQGRFSGCLVKTQRGSWLVKGTRASMELAAHHLFVRWCGEHGKNAWGNRRNSDVRVDFRSRIKGRFEKKCLFCLSEEKWGQ